MDGHQPELYRSYQGREQMSIDELLLIIFFGIALFIYVVLGIVVQIKYHAFIKREQIKVETND